MTSKPLRKLKTWTVVVSLLLSINVAGAVGLGMATVERFRDIEHTWIGFNQEALRKSILLSQIRGHFGYGGFIHNFKNYVLRQQDRLLPQIEHDLKGLRAAIEAYRDVGISPAEVRALDTVSTTIDLYASKLPIAIRGAEEGLPPVEIDPLVKVDDTDALGALSILAGRAVAAQVTGAAGVRDAVQEGRTVTRIGMILLPLLAISAIALVWLLRGLMRELAATAERLRHELAERERADAMVRKLGMAVDQTPAGVIVTDLEGKIEYANPSYQAITGLSPDAILGHKPDIFTPESMGDGVYRAIWREINARHQWRGLFSTRRHNGDLYWAATVVSPVIDDHDRLSNFVAIIEDVTDRKQAEERLNHVQKMEAMGVMAGGIAHDFNNILTGVMGHCQLMREDLPPASEALVDLDKIETALERARALINQMLTFSRRTDSEPRLVPLEDLIAEVFSLIRAAVPSRILLKQETDDTSGLVLADPTQIHQVLMNLCTNAVDAIGSVPGIVAVRLYGLPATDPRPADQPDLPRTDFAVIEVADTGDGIPDSVIPRIFDPFFTTKPVGKGTGLGLSVVDGIIRAHSGAISLDSAPGEGTTFRIYLPCSGSTASTPPQLASAS